VVSVVKILWRLALVASLLFALRYWLGLPEVRQHYGVPYDKCVHAGVFFVIPFLLAWTARWPVWVLLCMPALAAGVEEYMQQYQPGRSAEIADWQAGMYGIVAACFFIAIWRWWRGRAA
jgi:VanZ family protein